MTTNANLVSRTLFHVGNRTSYRSQVLATMQAWVAERERDSFLPWFLEKESSGLVTMIDQDYIALPVDFLREYDEGIMLVEDEEGIEHKMVKVASLDRLFQEEDEGGLPEGYFISGARIYMRPTPDAAYSVRFFYYGKSAVMEDDSDEAEYWGAEAENALVFGAGAIFAATTLQNKELAQSLTALEKRAMTALLIANEARIHSGQQLVIEE